MIKIITAIGNPTINKMLSLYNQIDILNEDIQYKEAIIEILEKNNKTDFLIINKNLPGDINNRDLKKILNKQFKNIKIIEIEDEKRKNEKRIFNRRDNYKIYDKQVNIILNEIGIENFTQNKNNEILKTYVIQNKYINFINKYIKISKIKSNVEENNLKKNIKNMLKKIRKKWKKNTDKIEKNKNIVIAGNSGVGKTIIMLNLAYFLSLKNIKVEICNYRYENDDINILFNVKRKLISKSNKVDIKHEQYCINKNLVLHNKLYIKLKDENIENYKISFYETGKVIQKEIEKEILIKSNNIFLIVEPNLIGVKKAKNILEYYEKTLKIEKEKINIIINKKNKYSINDQIIKNIFIYYNLIGKIKYENKYNYYINKKYKKIFKNKKIKNEYKKIIKNIL